MGTRRWLTSITYFSVSNFSRWKNLSLKKFLGELLYPLVGLVCAETTGALSASAYTFPELFWTMECYGDQPRKTQFSKMSEMLAVPAHLWLWCLVQDQRP